MTRMEPTDWRQRVGQHVEKRRVDLKYRSANAAAKAAGFSPSVWRQIESGRRHVAPGHPYIAPSPEPATQQLAARVLHWEDNWLDELLAGRTPKERARPTKVKTGAGVPPSDLPSNADLLEALEELTTIARYTNLCLHEIARARKIHLPVPPEEAEDPPESLVGRHGVSRT